MNKTLKILSIVTFAVGMLNIGQVTGKTLRVLFLGNSYTAYNNLPALTDSVARSSGDTLITGRSVQGGYSLKDHCGYDYSLSQIRSGNWDYIVLQEQSQLPSFPIEQVEDECFPYAAILDSIFNLYNPCGETMFYMTWGRKNGDPDNCAVWPPVCTYEGMDSLINLRTMMMAERQKAVVSPVGAVWHHIRDNYPNLELYAADESHPSIAGTYAAACCFYCALFRRDPTLITYNHNLPENDAAIIKSVVKRIVYDSLMNWHIGEYDLKSAFSWKTADTNTVKFINLSKNADTFYWEFGDGAGSDNESPEHIYLAPGTYQVRLIVTKCNQSDTSTHQVTVGLNSIDETGGMEAEPLVFPNPTTGLITIGFNSRYTSSCYITISSLSGISLIDAHVINNDKVNLSGLTPGIYIITIKGQNGKVYTEKIIRL